MMFEILQISPSAGRVLDPESGACSWHGHRPCVRAKSLCDPMECSPPGSSIHGDSPGKNTGVGCQALLQEIFPTHGSKPHLLCLPALASGFFTTSTTGEAWAQIVEQWLMSEQMLNLTWFNSSSSPPKSQSLGKALCLSFLIECMGKNTTPTPDSVTVNKIFRTVPGT